DMTPRGVLLAATKCAGCVLHVQSVCTAWAGEAEAVVGCVAEWAGRAQYAGDKAAQQTAAWSVGVARLDGPAVARLVPRLAAVLGGGLGRLGGSRAAQFESLCALEALLRRAPSAMRAAHPAWLLPVLACVGSPIAGIRAKAGGIVRLNMPWVAADAHAPEVDALVSRFAAGELSRLLAAARRLGDGEPAVAARVCGMALAVCARHGGAWLDDAVGVLETCFGGGADALAAALMQWRCVVYALHVQRQLHHQRYAVRALRPLAGVLATATHPAAVHVAAVRTWATLVYALGEHTGGLIQEVLAVARAAQAHGSREVRQVVCRVLRALLCRLEQPAARVPAFVVPQMILGTTTLAAADGARSLASTHGPFSSEHTASGDHTRVLARYVIGLDPRSPTVPVLVRAATDYVHACVDALREEAEAPPGDDALSALCVTLAVALPQLDDALGAAAALARVLYRCADAAAFATRACVGVRRALLSAVEEHVRPLMHAQRVASCALTEELVRLPSFATATMVSCERLAGLMTHARVLDL
ncbi:hypothetical protein LPJ73_006764, partial [Coemansia sp. RSA 2703]